jgi:hypothetical protein
MLKRYVYIFKVEKRKKTTEILVLSVLGTLKMQASSSTITSGKTGD